MVILRGLSGTVVLRILSDGSEVQRGFKWYTSFFEV